MPTYYNPVVFSLIVRYLIKAAQDKRAVPYFELENLFGLSHNMAGFYAGCVGNFCQEQGWPRPLLNSLVINTKNCQPSEGFDGYLPEDKSWGNCLSECWAYFHVTSPREQQVRNFSGLTKLLRDWSLNTALNN